MATLDGLVAALTEQQGWAEVTAPSDISIDGYAGNAFQRTAPAVRSRLRLLLVTSTPSNASVTSRPTGSTPNASVPPPNPAAFPSPPMRRPEPDGSGLLVPLVIQSIPQSSAHLHQWCPYASRTPVPAGIYLVMLSLWKLRVGVESYYLAQVASGLDEYYTGSHESLGVWRGTGSTVLGLVGDVAADELRAVLAGLAPGTGLTPNGTRLSSHSRRVPGFDLTFAVPKSVSVLWALGDPFVQTAVVEACETAVDESLSWLEREACFVRRGTNNRRMVDDSAGFGTRRMVADGFVAAEFRHRTSRLGDPHLHWHVLVANTARGIDGRWSALDGTALYRSARTAGVLFQAAMRRELTERLGVEWGPTHHDSAEIAGIPLGVLREFSRRSEQIAEWMDLHGLEGPSAADQALLETRLSKQVPADFATVEAEWRDRADRLGWSAVELEHLLAGVPGRPVDGDQRWLIGDTVGRGGSSAPVARQVGFDEWVEWLLVHRITDTTATFTRFALTQAVASHLPADTTLAAIEATVHRALGSPAVVQVGDHWLECHPLQAPDRMIVDDRELRYTSRSLLDAEQRLIDGFARGVGAGVGVIGIESVTAAVGMSALGEDQAAAVVSLTSLGDRVAVMVGRAGTGKTHTLGTIRVVYEDAGWVVIGLAPSARAARELQDGSAITSTTIARHRVEQRQITATTLVVVDEAAMAGTRDLAAIIDQVTAIGAKIVLVGDHHQLPEVSAGGAFRAALDTLGDRVAELTINRRQQHAWERAALDELRCGDIPTAFAAYRDHGRVVISDTPEDVHAIALADWYTARHDTNTLLLAGTRAEARLLNRHARRILAANGDLNLDHEIEFSGRSFAVGDDVVMLRNDPHQQLVTGEQFAVDNGMRGTITNLGPEQMRIRTTSGEHVVLDADYLEHGWVDHAYAITIHKAQGVTCDNVFLVGPAGLYREGAYVALSRARNEARLYVTSTQASSIEERHQHGIPLPTEPQPDPEAELLARLHRSAAENLVTIDDPDAARIADLVRTTPAPELACRLRHAAWAEQHCDAADPRPQRAALDTAIETRTHLDVGRRVRAIDRDNVGTVIAINDIDGTCTIHFENADGHTAVKQLDWSKLIVIDHPDTVLLTDAAEATLARRADIVETVERRWAEALVQHGVAPGDADRYRRATHTAVDQSIHELRADQPDWLTTWLGDRPTTPAAASVWDNATARIAEHRLLNNVPDRERGLGDCPTEPADIDRWQDLMLRLLEDRIWLSDHTEPSTQSLVVMSPTELIERQQELHELVDSAPADQGDFIGRITRSQLDATEIHEYLSAALGIQNDRRAWIIANWPHIVELEQITQLIAQQAPLAHWPAALPEPVQHALDQLRQLAPQVDNREDRTLAELDQLEADQDPVRRLETRRAHLRELAGRPLSSAERVALDRETAKAEKQIRTARRERRVERAFDRYIPSELDDARTTRITTVAHDVLTTEPVWINEQLHALHNNDELEGVSVAELARRVTHAAVHHDRHGTWPTDLTHQVAVTVERPVPVPELG